jgi:hypothetical protein
MMWTVNNLGITNDLYNIIGWQSRCKIQNYFCKGLKFYYIWDNVIMIIRNAIIHSKFNIETITSSSNNLQCLQDVNGF